MGPMWLGVEVTRSRVDSGAEVTGAEVSCPKWLGPMWLGAEVTRGRGGSGAEVSVNIRNQQTNVENYENCFFFRLICRCRHGNSEYADRCLSILGFATMALQV